MNIVITGASRGLGKAMAHSFAAAGHSLYLIARQPQSLYSTMEELLLAYPSIQIKAKPFDLSVKEEAQAAGAWALATAERIDVLINNAGSFIPGNVHDEPDGNLETLMQVNLFSAYHLTRAVLPTMIAQPMVAGNRGHIFNICSIASLQAYTQGGSYSISKFALLGFSKNLREEMKTHAIKVTAVLPGAAYTDSWEGSGISRARIMEAGDIARMVLAATQLSAAAVVEDIILRPQLGDL
jgi:short-subunit dehydrogenase